MTHFLFYDFETSGLAIGFDQVLQIGAIACDPDLRPVPEARMNARCRLMPHVIPSPTALYVTRLHPDRLDEPETRHWDLMAEFERFASRHGPATFIGHNSLGFDESVLRHARFQSLLDPYLTNKHGNRRGDTMRFARAVWLFRPGEIDLPVTDSGRPSFKLGLLAATNGIAFDAADAHDALYDVEKTAELAAMIRERSPAVWRAMLDNTAKQNAERLMRDNPVFAAGHVDRFNTLSAWAGSLIGTFQSEAAVLDLATDPDDLTPRPVEELIDLIGTDPAQPIKPMRLNAQPYAVPLDVPSEGYFARLSTLDRAEWHRRAERLAANGRLRQKILEAMSKRFADREPSPHVEGRLYDGFIPRHDEPLMARFRDAPPEERQELIGQFEDKRLASFARRIVYFDSPHALPAGTVAKLDAWKRARLVEAAEVPWTTLPAARAELATLRETEGNDPLFDAIDAYLDRREAALSA